MADLFSGPHMPLGKAFLFCGWRVLPVDWLLDPDHDLSIPACQARVHEQLQDASFIAAALDCSTKSRAREIPRVFNDGRRTPGPLRSPQFPAGLPELTGKDKARVDKDNSACSFVLTEIEELLYRGGGSIRENPFNSLHWQYPQEVAMWESGFWHDWRYSACCFGGARNKLQRIRRNIEEFDNIPRAECHHVHCDREWEPWVDEHGVTVYPSKEEAEYTAELCFVIAAAASWWAARVGLAVVDVPRAPSPECTGPRSHWLDFEPRSLREWAMTPLALSLGLQPLHEDERVRVPQRASAASVAVDGKLPPMHIMLGKATMPPVSKQPSGNVLGS